ncbi:hypothetical protein [Puniceicoccus vermicola]|uniref:Uncharacterized protein n=1 Tax=Puniceicoccus vermicola TaxID=388746 RepID=A0A7X1B3I6_9BACT|nr:hypothetical protein [Puniceicoccus vermicola]MBC2603750.1 hypothetical protein [Puniceicoccus vermicola]
MKESKINYNRKDGFGNSIIPVKGKYSFVFICPECGENDVVSDFNTPDEAESEMERRISEHKMYDNCTFDWVGFNRKSKE